MELHKRVTCILVFVLLITGCMTNREVTSGRLDAESILGEAKAEKIYDYYEL